MPETPTDDAVVIERTFPAAAATVWSMWTDPDHFAAWYGPDGVTVTVTEMDVRPGGRRRITMAMPTPDGAHEMWFAGEHREFAHVAGRFQPSVQFAAGRRGSLALTWSTERVDFDEQPGLISLDYWQHGPSVRFRTRVGPIADLTAEYAFRMQRYDDELASLRTGQERPTNPVEKHNFDRLSVDARLQPVEVVSVIVGYGFERKDDRYVGFESWTDHGLRAGFESSIAPRITLGVGLRYDNRRYDNRLGDDGARLRYDLVVVEGSAALEMTEHLSLYATARSANRNTNRSFGSEFLDIKVSQVASGIAFTY